MTFSELVDIAVVLANPRKAATELRWRRALAEVQADVILDLRQQARDATRALTFLEEEMGVR